MHSEQQYVYLWSCILFSRLLCNVAFATCTYRLQPHRAARTSIPLRFIRSARFLTRLADASPSVQCVGHGFRHMCKKEERSSGMQAFLSPFLFFSTRCSMLNVKNRRPRGSQCPQKQRFLSARSGVRTLDTLIKSQVLCQLS